MKSIPRLGLLYAIVAVLGTRDFVDAAQPPHLLKAPFSQANAKNAQRDWSHRLKKEVVDVNSIGMKLTLIPPGEFVMGIPVTNPFFADHDFRHWVRISKAFYLGTYSVTQSEYARVMGNNPSRFAKTSDNQYTRAEVAGLDTTRFPVDSVSWSDANEFCKRLSELAPEKSAGRKYRLPTSAEWEYACRAGTTTEFYVGDSLAMTQANFQRFLPNGDREEKFDRPTTVGSYPPNPFGLYDMHGNMQQWCSDWFDPDLGTKTKAHDEIHKPIVVHPQGPANGTQRIARGGCYSSQDDDCRSGHCGPYAPTARGSNLGLRVVCYQETTNAK